jgi:hypothetical protein
MDMAVTLPGWNSVESITRWHRGFEIAGFIALGLLLLFEILTYIYGNRKDALLAAQQLTPTQWTQQQEKQQKANDEALEKLRKELQGAQEKGEKTAQELEQSKQKVAELAKAAEWRDLTADQVLRLDSVLSSSPKYAVSIAINFGDQEALRYANKLSAVFEKNGWSVEGGGTSQAMYDIPAKGIELTIRDPQNVPPGLRVVANALKQAGISFTPAWNENVAIGAIEIRVGTKQ